jgi:acetyl-CoA C-acetyltransferase
MWDEVSRAAAADASASSDVLGALESIQVVYSQSWQYDDPPRRLAQALDADPRHRFYSGIGGTTPQQLVNRAATEIVAGDLDLGLVVGAEALATVRRIRKAGERPAWSHRDPEKKPFPFEAPFLDTEIAHEVFQAWLTFPMWDLARRHALGVEPDDYRRQIGELLAPMTQVAAANPYAWFPVVRSADELSTPTDDNRMVGYPYTKYEVSVMDVDQAAAVIVASHAQADALGVPSDRRVYLRGWCYLTDPYYLAQHHDYTRSPAMRAAADEAMRCAGLRIDEVAHLDLYSCFASSVHLALDALGLRADDPRGVTVTGGLPFAGGAGSNYLTHSIATMVEVLRRHPGDHGLVSGVGMHMTKHVYGLYSTVPGSVALPHEAERQAELDATGCRAVVPGHVGLAQVATYSVAHGRGGEPEWGLAICDLPGGERCYGRVHDPDLLAEIEQTEWVGSAVDLVDGGGGVNLIKT